MAAAVKLADLVAAEEVTLRMQATRAMRRCRLSMAGVSDCNLAQERKVCMSFWDTAGGSPCLHIYCRPSKSKSVKLNWILWCRIAKVSS